MQKDICQVKVVIPIYRAELKDWERASLANTMQVLAAYPIVWLKPEDVDLHDLTALYPQAEIMNVSSEWLGTKNGIAGYNRMMMSESFYDLFGDTTYVLICHLDAWIFRDEVLRWCETGYDLVAAPWPTRPRYNYFPFKQFLQLKKYLFASKRIIRSQMYGKIGNGGLCLRKVEAFKVACRSYASEIAYFLSKPEDGLYNEDIFWALIPKELKYPTVEEALQFAYDLKPKVCHYLNHKQLPMGCHGFMHKSRIRFWEPFIPCIKTML